jgi:outer membrane protein assembly factor BamA
MRCLIAVLSFFLLGCLALQANSADVTSTNDQPIIIKTLKIDSGKLSEREKQFVVHDIESGQYKLTELEAVAERARFALQRLGYFKVLVNDPVVRIVGRERDRKIVTLVLTVQEGELYRLKDIRFTNVNAFTPEELRATFPIADGDIFDRGKVGAGIEQLRRLYGSKGYVNFAAVPQTEVDESRRAVSLVMDLDTGAQFRFGKLNITGEESEPGARERLLNAWKSHEGEVFDYRVLDGLLRQLHARASVRPEDVFELSPDAEARVVNVHMTLVRPTRH